MAVVSFVTLFQWRLNSLLLHENEKEILIPSVRDQIQSLVAELDEVGSFVGDGSWILHARAIATSFFRFLGIAGSQLEKKERGQIASFIRRLDKVTGVSRDAEKIWACYASWVSEIWGMLRQVEDYIDDFIAEHDDQKQSTAQFGRKIEKMRSRGAKIFNRRPQLVGVFWRSSRILEDIQKFITSKLSGPLPPLVSCMLSYISLPYDLKLSVILCDKVNDKTKSNLVRVLVAAGLVEEKPGEAMEDKAQENIERLLDLGMLRESEISSWNRTIGPPPDLCPALIGMKAEDFYISSARPILTLDQQITSLHWLFVPRRIDRDCFMITDLQNAKHLRVLDIHHGQLDIQLSQLNIQLDQPPDKLPDGIGKLVHLRYLAVKPLLELTTDVAESISSLRNLQTLNIHSFTSEIKVLNGVLNLVQLRHLKLKEYSMVGGGGWVTVPPGISGLRNLESLEGIYAGCGIAKELGLMTQLRSLDLRDLSDDHADELYISLMNLTVLLNLSLAVELVRVGWKADRCEISTFPCLESLKSPPPLLQTLQLDGRLVEMPVWLGSMENLTKLHLLESRLSENPTTILQFLPNLKHLVMCDAYKGKRMGRESFRAEGFPKLEYLCICASDLVEWTEIEEGSLPCLKQLTIEYCYKLMLLPEGLQHVTTLQRLKLWRVHEDVIRRLSPNGRGPENYKIKHIPLVEYLGDTSSGTWRREPPPM